MQVNLIKNITDFIVNEVKEKSIMNGFQYIVNYSNIAKEFNILVDQYLLVAVVDMLEDREEVADIQLDGQGIDVVLYTDYAPNYDSELYRGY
ncbi:MAG: hypothetical protein RR782_02575 [Clostridium sp.]